MWKNKVLNSNWQNAIFTVTAISGLIISIRILGWLQPFELMALDIYFQLRPPEPLDSRIILVGVTEQDEKNLRGWPTNDWALAKLLEKIKYQQPRAIGLNIYRTRPVEPGHAKLARIFKTTPNLIGIQKLISNKSSSAIPPPPLLEQRDQVSASDLILDSDGVVRRAILFPIPGKDIQSLGLAVSLIYLNEQGISPEAASNGFMKIGSVVFTPFRLDDGGYIGADAGGYQVLLNYRGSAQSFSTVSITDVLHDRISPNLMRDRIVLIGSSGASFNDAFLTPYSRNLGAAPDSTSGVEVQANLASQIISAVLDNRPLIKTWNEPLEILWSITWGGIIVVLGWSWRQDRMTLLKIAATFLLAVVCLTVGTYITFLLGWWVPVVPPLLSLIVSTVVVTGCVYTYKVQEANSRALLLGSKFAVTKQLLEESEKRSLD